MTTNDSEIINLFRIPEKKHQAFGLLTKKYSQKLYWHIKRMLIDHDDTNDVLQNVLIKAYNNLDNFKENSSLYTWLYRIATNETITFLNSTKKLRSFIITDQEEVLSKKLETDPYFTGDELQLKFQKAILKLPEKQRLVFNMRYYEELSYEEISQIMETSVGALKASYHHAVKKLENILSDN